jgi:tetratricopeptide (TPR) repeat protein
MSDKPQNFYGSREPDRTSVEPRQPSPHAERWLNSVSRNPLSTLALVVLLVGFIAVLVVLIVYQRAAMERVRQEAPGEPRPLQLAPPVRTGMELDIDAAGRLILDEIEPTVEEEELRGGPSALTPRWVQQAAFNLRQAQRAYAEQNWAAALRDYGAAVKILPGLSGVREIIGLCHLRLREYAKAEEVFVAALEAQPGSPALLNNLGVALMGQNRMEEAEVRFRAAIEARADYLPARQNQALLLFRADRFEEAAAAFGNLLKTDPQNVEAALMLAACWMRLDRWSDAAQALNELVRMNPQNAPVHFRLAEARGRTGDLDGAMKALEAGLDLVDVPTAVLWLNRREFDALRDRPDFQARVVDLTKAMK